MKKIKTLSSTEELKVKKELRTQRKNLNDYERELKRVNSIKDRAFDQEFAAKYVEELENKIPYYRQKVEDLTKRLKGG